MPDVDAVIAALRIVLHEAETRRTEHWWKIHIVNKWIDQLPGAQWGRWRQLQLRADSGSLSERQNLVAHVRATLAYLETNRDTIAAQRPWWPFGRRALRGAQAPAQKEMPNLVQKRQERPTIQDGANKPKWLN
jgi:hypothetical protein